MPQIINTNIPSLTAQRNLNTSQSAQATALARLSSGLRINSARDDAAGLAISTRFDTQVRGLNVAIRNAGDGVSLAQVTESSLGAMTNNLQRVRELALQSANGTNNELDRQAINKEVQQLKEEIRRISEQANFNGTKLLDGSFSNITFQIGANAGESVEVSIDGATVEELGASITSGVSARGTKSSLQGGDIIINGVSIPAAKTTDDTASVALKSASAIAKVAAINLKTDDSGVSAEVLTNSAEGSAQTIPPGGLTGEIYLNGQVIDITVSSSFSAEANREATVSAINAFTLQNGVRAINTGNDNTGIVLEAVDGRNITLLYDATMTPGASGLPDSDLDGDLATKPTTGNINNPPVADLEKGTMAGGYTLISADGKPIEIQQGTTGDLNQNAGLAEGLYSANGAFLNSLSLSADASIGENASPLINGEIVINGVPVPAANALDDTASFERSPFTNDKEASAIAVAAAINKVAEQTSVSAEPNENLINGSDMSGATPPAAATGVLTINGVSTSTLTVDADDPELSRLSVINAINAITGQTGVVASDTGSDTAGVQLEAADGRNIFYTFDYDAGSTVPPAGIPATVTGIVGGAGLDDDHADINFSTDPVIFDITVTEGTTTAATNFTVTLDTNYQSRVSGGGLNGMITEINQQLSAANAGFTASMNGATPSELVFTEDFNGGDSIAIVDGGGIGDIAVLLGGAAPPWGVTVSPGTVDTATEDLTGLPSSDTVYISSVRLNSSAEFDLSSTQPNGLANHGLTFGAYGSGTDGQFIADIDVSTVDGALKALAAVDNALQTINIQRATLGAVQNRFESTITNQQIATENLAAANSRIRDADFAAETAELSRAQVLQQAGISILSQANALPQQVLSLLQ